MGWHWKLVLILIFNLFTSFYYSQAQEVKFEIKKIIIGNKSLVVEVADTPERSARGLMDRRSLDENSGMLFIFEGEQTRNFWMKNTYIPLSIGFFDKDKVLVDVQDMEPVHSVIETPKTYASNAPAKYALEVNKGWFEKNKIRLKTKFKFK